MNLVKKTLFTVKLESPILYRIVMINFAVALGCVPLLLMDERTLFGLNVWMKPIKFLISTGIYILTVGVYINFYPYSKTKKNVIRNIVSWTLLLEVGIVVAQAARGVQSHYNQSSLLDGMLFVAMGVLIGINVFVMFLFIIDTIRLKLTVAKPLQWSILLGWLIVFFGSWIGGQMIGQMSHNVGIQDGGAGLPFINWSTVAGDLRVAHFFGLHGLQIVPLFALGLTKFKMKNITQVFIISCFAFIYIALIVFTFYQAQHGIPFLQLYTS